jgi:hypothetical protein
MKFILIRALLFNLLVSFFLYSVENPDFYDSVNARKDFFYGNSDWDKLIGKKTFIDDNRIGLVCAYDIPVSISRTVFEGNILGSLSNENDRKVISSNYILMAKQGLYVLNTGISNDDAVAIFKSIKLPIWDYNFNFYNTSPEFEKTLVKKGDIPYIYGRISYQFDYKKTLVRVKIFFQNNNNSYIEFNTFQPNKFDVYLFGKPVKKGLPYYFSFDSLKFQSVTSILSLLDKENIRKETKIADNDYEVKKRLIDRIIVPSVIHEYNDDGARDEFGNFVLISTGEPQSGKNGFNCSGFAKDVVDNYIRLFDADFKWLPISDLKKRRTEERKNSPFNYLENKYEPFFGLDWSENLADKINEYCGYKIIKAGILDNDENAQYYNLNGYSVRDLKEILFRDQNRDSSFFYILAFNKLRTISPPIPVFYHIAVAVPYFKDDHFFIRTFESADETDFAKMVALHEDEKVAIIRVPVPFIQLDE